MVFPVKRRLWFVLALAVCLFLVYSAVGERGIVRLNRMMDQRDELRSTVRALAENNVKLGEQVSLLRDDPATIEYLARTELGMVRTGETVYIITNRTNRKPM